MMKLITGMIVLFLVGCTSVAEKDSNDPEQIIDKSHSEKSNGVNQVTEISPEVLYLLLTAEIAGQRNLYGVALDGYLRAARRVDDVRVAERATKIGLYVKDVSKTDEAVALWLRQDAKSLTARKIAALSALREGDDAEAVEHLGLLLEEDPAGFESTLMELMKAVGKKNNTEFVFDVLDEVSMQHPDNASVLFVQALLAGQMQMDAIAKQKVGQALEKQPEWDKALILQAQLAAQEGDLALARDNLLQVLDSQPKNERVKRILGQVLMKSEDFDGAIDLYQEILDDHPDDGESRFAIALIYLQQKEEDKALAQLKPLVNKPRWDAQASFYIGRIEFKKENYDQALTWFDKVTQGPYNYDASMAAVSVLLNQKDYPEAESRLIDLSNKFPAQKLDITLLSADIYNEQEKYQKAFDLLTEVMIQDKDNRDLLYARALIAEKLNRLDVLEADLKNILEKEPEDVAALNALGYTLVDRTDRYQEAEEYILKAIVLKPDEAVIIDSLGWLQFKQGKIDEALITLRMAYDKQQESEISAHLAEVLWLHGDAGEAKEILDKALKKSPDDKYLLEFQKRFIGVK